jgi:general secretion pathway protein D
VNTKNRWLQILVVVVVGAILVGCSPAKKAFNTAKKEAGRENWDKAVLGFSKATALDPGNMRYTSALERAKLKASAQHFEKGRRYAAAAQWDLALGEFQQTLLLNPGNQHAATELEKALREIRLRDEGPSAIQRAKEAAKRSKLAPPKLDPRSNIPIVMMFRERPVKEVFEAMSKASGINFLYDDKVDLNKPITIDIGNVSLEKALDILMLQTKNFFKVIDENTLLIAPDQRQKRQEYEDQVIRTFFLSSGDTKQVVTLLRTLLNSRQIAENPDLNSVTIKDTPDVVAVAQRIIEANDKSRGEIIVNVELLEVDRVVTRNLGVDLSSKTLTMTFRDGQQSVPINNLQVLRNAGNWLIGPIPSIVINFLKTDSDTQLLAKPQIRVSEGEQAEILIGDRVPIPTTTFNTSQTVGGNIVPITSFTYQNVGITVQIEPRVHHNKEVTLKLNVEFSQVTGTVEGIGGQAQPIIGTRNIQTVIRLRDGETNLLAGLIRRTDEVNVSGVPGLTAIPGIGGYLFGNTSRTINESDIILTLTPSIIRIPNITEEDLATMWVGTQDQIQLRGPARGVLNVSPFGTADESYENDYGGPYRSEGYIAPLPPGEGVIESEPAPYQPPGETAPPPDTGGPAGGGAAGAAAGAAAGGAGAEGGEDAASPTGEPDAGDTPPAGPTVVRLIPTAAQYNVGDTVQVQVVIENAQNVGSIPFHIRYNASALQYVRAEEGQWLRSGGVNTIFLDSPSVGGGEVIVGYSRMGGGEGASGSGIVATFYFQAIAPGDANFMFTSASVKDPRARNLPASFATGQASVR